MEDNYIFCLKAKNHDSSIPQKIKNPSTQQRENFRKINTDLKNKIMEQKNCIQNNEQWDDAKRQMNDFENIYSSSRKHLKVCQKKTASRAYFKLWEILRDFHDEIFTKNSKTSAHLCEGPGGFCECIVQYKNDFEIPIKQMFGITLLVQSTDGENRVPFWKLSKDYCATHNILLNKRNDNIGDFYSFECINKFIKKCGLSSCDLITADGGFDFSVDFNHQEENFMRLLLSEIYTAVSIQRIGGTFIVKVFDTFTEETMCLISILRIMYEKVYFIKPFTSRPANSEKYLVCINYKNVKLDIINDCKNEVINQKGIMKSLGKYLDVEVLSRITVYNTYYTARQIKHLQKTLTYVTNPCVLRENPNELDRAQFSKCEKWCEKYKIK